MSPCASPHLVLGIRPGQQLLPLPQPMMMAPMPTGDAPPVVVTAMPPAVVTATVMEAKPVVVTATVIEAKAPQTLAQQVETLKAELGVEGDMSDAIHSAAKQLGVEAKGVPLGELAAMCLQQLGK